MSDLQPEIPYVTIRNFFILGRNSYALTLCRSLSHALRPSLSQVQVLTGPSKRKIEGANSHSRAGGVSVVDRLDMSLDDLKKKGRSER